MLPDTTQQGAAHICLHPVPSTARMCVWIDSAVCCSCLRVPKMCLPVCRSGGSDQIFASIVSVLLALMDGLTDRGQVLVIGATNRYEACSYAGNGTNGLSLRTAVIGVSSP